MSTEETRDNIAPEAQEEMSEESLNELRKIRRDNLKLCRRPEEIRF